MLYNLEEVWRRKNESLTGNKLLPLPGTVQDFIEFLGADSLEQVEILDFTGLEQLPRVWDELVNCGGRREGDEEIVWTWSTRKKRKNFSGRGKNYNVAAMEALIVWWELITRRKQQSDRSSPIYKILDML